MKYLKFQLERLASHIFVMNVVATVVAEILYVILLLKHDLQFQKITLNYSKVLLAVCYQTLVLVRSGCLKFSNLE